MKLLWDGMYGMIWYGKGMCGYAHCDSGRNGTLHKILRRDSVGYVTAGYRKYVRYGCGLIHVRYDSLTVGTEQHTH